MAPADIRRLSDEWGLVVDLHLATVRRICPSLSCVMSHHLFVECRHVGPAPVARERAVLRDAGEAGGRLPIVARAPAGSPLRARWPMP
jgi:hypothetical protein